MEGQYLSLLGPDLSLQEADGLVLFLQTAEELLLVFLEEVDLFEEDGQHSLIFVVLNLFLVAFDPPLVLQQSLLDLHHVLPVGLHELCLLPLQHRVHLTLQVHREPVEPPHQLLYLPHVVLNAPSSTL